MNGYRLHDLYAYQVWTPRDGWLYVHNTERNAEERFADQDNLEVIEEDQWLATFLVQLVPVDEQIRKLYHGGYPDNLTLVVCSSQLQPDTALLGRLAAEHELDVTGEHLLVLDWPDRVAVIDHIERVARAFPHEPRPSKQLAKDYDKYFGKYFGLEDE